MLNIFFKLADTKLQSSPNEFYRMMIWTNFQAKASKLEINDKRNCTYLENLFKYASELIVGKIKRL